MPRPILFTPYTKKYVLDPGLDDKSENFQSICVFFMNKIHKNLGLVTFMVTLQVTMVLGINHRFHMKSARSVETFLA